MPQASEDLTAELSRKLENKKRAVFYLSLLLLAAGCAGFVLTAGVAAPIEEERMIVAAVCAGAFLSIVFGTLSVYLLSGYTTTVRAILPTLLVGGMGFLLCSWVAVSYLNVALDRSPLKVHEAALMLKTVSKEKKDHFLVNVRSWKDKQDVITFPVTKEEYQKIQEGPCRITTRAGYFGFEWIVSSDCR